ncbi:carbonate dehydratase [Cladophialophora yegresii CBS 114405]|uniref:Carbonic anhydrase n=1 Tax=Cladophialophora yegresii CBS 114405 TaxID=1182544 RepID=W9WXB5_9EURO|nr:carbonate dehydratase [Cladophialophora yegresii CBS 114405]EXJ62894.1 carbonate dehydratase [Cladophialophora yegresii CBS 114405]
MTRMKNNPKAYGPHVLIVSCFDSRADPFDFLKLMPRECLVLRNVAGRFSTVAEQIAALDTLFHVSQIVLVHHSNCGASHVTTQQGLESVREKRPDFTEFKELEARLPIKEDNYESVIEDLQMVKRNGYLRKDLTDGAAVFWLDVETGLLTRVYADGSTSRM